MNKLDILKNGLDEIGIKYSQDQFAKLELYISEVELWNNKYKLVGAIGEQFIIKHILDSLSAYHELTKLTFKTAADIGSGAGLPGIPLAIFFPEVHFTLIERSGRRAGFLRNIVSLLNMMDQVVIIESELEEVKDKYDLILFRAFRNLVDFYESLIRIKAPEGAMFAYKGKIEIINTEISSLKTNMHINIVPGFVPFLEEERNFLVFTQPFPDIL
ncbi:MAG: 16S rRNA (guanine(527)-N(7))-methyltransferase RsmG [Spirochaetales bacterium]|nr:16S rRNA (guanine(527)-N(7))-methyltransferase RsmG [Spirochaetales bacterium]